MSENKKQLSSNKDQMINLGSVFMDVAKEWLMILLLTASAAIAAHVGMGAFARRCMRRLLRSL